MKCSSGLRVPSFPLSRTLFSSKGSLVYNDPDLYPAKEINSNRTSSVSLIRRSNLSSSVPRCPRGHFSFSSPLLRPFSKRILERTLPSAHRFPPSLYLSSLHQLPLCSRAPAISYRNLSCAPKHFSENRLARAVAGQSPKC